MTARVQRSPRARAIAVLVAIVVLAASVPGTALSATHASKPPSFPIPASERLGNATAAKTSGSTTSVTVHPTATTNTSASALPTPSASATPNPGGARSATGKSSTTTPGAPAATTTGPAQTQSPSAAARTLTPAGAPLASAHSGRGGASHLSRTAVIVAIVAGLIALGSAIWVLLRWLAPEPRWARSLMYSVDEASSRASATWSEFTDWVRLGR